MYTYSETHTHTHTRTYHLHKTHHLNTPTPTSYARACALHNATIPRNNAVTATNASRPVYYSSINKLARFLLSRNQCEVSYSCIRRKLHKHKCLVRNNCSIFPVIVSCSVDPAMLLHSTYLYF